MREVCVTRNPVAGVGAGKLAGVSRKCSLYRYPSRTANSSGTPSTSVAGWGCRAPATRRRTAARPTSTIDIPRWNRPASECGQGATARVTSRPCGELVHLGLTWQALHTDGLAR